MKRISTYHICMLAFAIVINIVGGEIALLFHLPIYLDSIGTILIAAICGPLYGMLPSVLSGLIFGMSSDIYALYYAPVGILLGLLAGYVWKRKRDQPYWLWISTLVITLPTSFLSACITAGVFGGITSSGSAILVQLLAKTPLGLTLSCFIVQVFSEYLDRLLSMFLVLMVVKKLPKSLLQKLNTSKAEAI